MGDVAVKAPSPQRSAPKPFAALPRPGDILTSNQRKAAIQRTSALLSRLSKETGTLWLLIEEYLAPQPRARRSRDWTKIRPPALQVKFPGWADWEQRRRATITGQGRTFLIEYDNTQNHAITSLCLAASTVMGEDCWRTHQNSPPPSDASNDLICNPQSRRLENTLCMYGAELRGVQGLPKNQSHRNGVSTHRKGKHSLACPQRERVFLSPTLIQREISEQTITEGTAGEDVRQKRMPNRHCQIATSKSDQWVMPRKCVVSSVSRGGEASRPR